MALAQLVPLTGVADGEQLRRINGVFKEITTSPSGEAGKLVPALLDSLGNLDQNAMNQVYQQVQTLLSDPSVVEALVQALKSNNAETASGILANSRNVAGRALIGGVFRHYPEGNLDFTAAQVQEIILALGSENRIVRVNLAHVLGNVMLPADTTVQDALIRLLIGDPQSQVRTSAANSLATFGREVYFKNAAPIAMAFAKVLLEDASPTVRSAAAAGLAQMGGKAEPAAAALKKALTDNSSQVRAQVLQTVINIGPAGSACIPELIDMYNAPNDMYRNFTKDRVVQAFGAIGPGALMALPLIVSQLKEHTSCMNAANAISNIGQAASPAVPELIKVLDSPYSGDRDAAARALGAIGPKAKSSLTALRKASDDERSADGNHFHNKHTFTEAIMKIEGRNESDS